MRRTALLACTALAATAGLAAPATAPAADPCIATPSVETCGALVSRYVPQAGWIIYYAQHPGEIIICVRECGPPQ